MIDAHYVASILELLTFLFFAWGRTGWGVKTYLTHPKSFLWNVSCLFLTGKKLTFITLDS
jgi:hypothetical protein